MGLFDNLIKKGKDLINQVKKNIENNKIDTHSTAEPIENVKNTENNKSEPKVSKDNNIKNSNNKPKVKEDNVFSDETIKKYYEVIFGMIKSTGEGFLKNEKISLITKDYIEKQLNESCDDEKMKEALDLFKLSKSDVFSDLYNLRTSYLSRNNEGLEKSKSDVSSDSDNNKKILFLRRYNEGLEKTNKYLVNNFDIVNQYFQDEYKLIEKDFEDILETIKNDPKVYYFGQGINERIYKKYESSLGKRLTQFITLKIVYKSLTSGNRLVQVLMQGAILTFFNVILSNNSGSQLESKLSRGLAIIAVRALHFEKSPENVNIDNNEYRELLLSHDYYKKEYGPFVSEDKISDEIRINFDYDNNSIYPGDYVLKNIVNFESGLKGYECIGNILHLDNKIYNLTCNLIWKEAIKNGCTNDSGEDITNSQEVADIFTILNHYYVEIYGGVILG